MEDWQAMELAPKGFFKKIASGKGEALVHVPERIIMALAENEQVVLSQWNAEDKRWSGISKDKNTPIGWKPWPKHPNHKENNQ